ncbi:hypothetical protein [Mesorhizobium sp.]|nr:hypothetical protein [Mesorhizobium sp.]
MPPALQSAPLFYDRGEFEANQVGHSISLAYHSWRMRTVTKQRQIRKTDKDPSRNAALLAFTEQAGQLAPRRQEPAGRSTTIVNSRHHSTISFCNDVVILSHGRVKEQAPIAALATLGMDERYQHEPLE